MGDTLLDDLFEWSFNSVEAAGRIGGIEVLREGTELDRDLEAWNACLGPCPCQGMITEVACQAEVSAFVRECLLAAQYLLA